MSSLLHLGHGDIPHIKFLVGCLNYIYINPLLDRLQDVGIGLKIGNINVNNTGCADDIALLSTQLSDAQIVVNMALIIAPHRKAILVLCRFCRCVVGTRDPGRCVYEIHIRIDCMHYVMNYNQRKV
jgi:cytidine deaminase